MAILSAVLPYLIFAAMAATAGVLVVGIVAMFRGGPFNAKHANKLMRMRVMFQATALLLFAVFMLTVKG